MNKLMRYFVLILWIVASTAHANNLVGKLKKVSLELDRAGILAANCAMDAKADKKIHVSCIQANNIMQQANAKLERIATLNTDNATDITANINQIKAKISQVNEHLTEAKIVTSDYEWSNSYIPSIK